MRKLIKIFFILLYVNVTFAQTTTDYAYLCKTEVLSLGTRNIMRVSVLTNNSSYPNGFGVIASATNLGKTFYHFLELKNGFDTITRDIIGRERGSGYDSDGNNLDCIDGVEDVVILKENFNLSSVPPEFMCGFRETIYALHIIDGLPTGDNSLCDRNTLELSGGYDWQYYIGNNANPSDDQWKDYASAVANISVNIGDLYAAEGFNIIDLAPNAPERSLKFRTGHKESNKYVSAKSYQIIDCSPKFKGYYNKTKTSCAYKNDGRISLNFGRNIDIATEEKLVVTLFKEDLVHGNIVMDQYATIDNLIYNGPGEYGFVWPSDIDKGKYFFKYQSVNKDTQSPIPLPNADDNYWKSLEETPVFEIIPAENVNFTATKLGDESCFALKDGKIKLDITSGETGRSYQYILYEVNGTSVTLYRNWTSFTGISTIINNLEQKEYRIKVRDSEGCFAREN